MSRLLFALSLLLTIASAVRRAFAQPTPADRLKAIEAIYPPWRLGDGGDLPTEDLNSRCRRRMCSPISTAASTIHSWFCSPPATISLP
jgi:hypothetical protein